MLAAGIKSLQQTKIICEREGVYDRSLLRRLNQSEENLCEKLWVLATARVKSMAIASGITHLELWQMAGRRIAACGKRHLHLVIATVDGKPKIQWDECGPWIVEDAPNGRVMIKHRFIEGLEAHAIDI